MTSVHTLISNITRHNGHDTTPVNLEVVTETPVILELVDEHALSELSPLADQNAKTSAVQESTIYQTCPIGITANIKNKSNAHLGLAPQPTLRKHDLNVECQVQGQSSLACVKNEDRDIKLHQSTKLHESKESGFQVIT